MTYDPFISDSFTDKLYTIVKHYSFPDRPRDFYTFKYKSVKLTMFYGFIYYTIDINGVQVYSSRSHSISRWNDNVIASECKDKVITFVNRLYDKIIHEKEAELLAKLNDDKAKVKFGCSQLD